MVSGTITRFFGSGVHGRNRSNSTGCFAYQQHCSNLFFLVRLWSVFLYLDIHAPQTSG